MPTVPRVLIAVDYYLPGYRAGGPIRTLANIVEWLGDEFAFDILTRDRDLGDTQPYPGIRHGTWTQVGKARVRYLAPEDLGIDAWRGQIRAEPYHLYYLNSFFSRLTIKTLLLRRIGLLPDLPVVLAPCGEFSRGALALKGTKKGLYIALAKRLGLYDNVAWKVSSIYEKADLERAMGGRAKVVHIAPDLAAWPVPIMPSNRPIKEPGKARIAFLGRIARMKNVDFALSLLQDLAGDISFDIYGPNEDEAYWQECQEMIRDLPPHIAVRYCGTVKPEEVVRLLSTYDLLLLPSRGENFGHAILEAHSAGCPVLISDRTPWRDLSGAHAGWDLPLSEPRRFVEALQRLVGMDDAEHRTWSEGARRYAMQYAQDPSVVAATRNSLLAALQAGQSHGSTRDSRARRDRAMVIEREQQ